MRNINRRDFLKYSTSLAVAMGLEISASSKIADALAELAAGDAPVLWLQAQSCSGCSVSLLNSEHPGPVEVLTTYIDLVAHSTLSTATGHTFVDIVNTSIQKGGYFLVVEGSIPVGMPEACLLAHVSLVETIAKAAKQANAVIAVGACATSGGIPAAENNPTGAIGVGEFLQSRSIVKPLINLPGCPCHPDWLVGTIAHMLKFGLPPLDKEKRPLMFYEKLIHDTCPRFSDYEREKFAEKFGDEGCLFKLGCAGPLTHADCTERLWNGGTNSCIKAGAPCIGCASTHFAKEARYSFYRKNPRFETKQEEK